MKKKVMDLSTLSNEDRIFFKEMTSYISEHVLDIELVHDEITVSFIEKYEQEVSESLIKLFEMISTKITKSDDEKVKTTILEAHTQNLTLNKESIYEKMINDHSVVEITPGSYAYSGLFLKVYQYFSKKIEEFALNHFDKHDVSEFQVPALYSIEEYDKAGYFDQFPHHMMFETSLENSLTTLDEFSKHGISKTKLFDKLKKPNNLLRTATCAPLYPMLKDQVIKASDTKIFLVSGKCYRNEGMNIKELSRLNEFYMKEFVFIGAADKNDEYVEKAKEIWGFWIEIFNLNCYMETANDSFFASNYKMLKLFQMIGNSKVEFKLQIPSSGEYISCSSTNNHRTHFTKTYNIKNNVGEYCFSSCFAFGIDRLTFALLSQKGLDVELWDEQTKKEISKYVEL